MRNPYDVADSLGVESVLNYSLHQNSKGFSAADHSARINKGRSVSSYIHTPYELTQTHRNFEENITLLIIKHPDLNRDNSSDEILSTNQLVTDDDR